MHSLSLCQVCCVPPMRWADAQPQLMSGVLCAPRYVPHVCAHTPARLQAWWIPPATWLWARQPCWELPAALPLQQWR